MPTEKPKEKGPELKLTPALFDFAARRGSREKSSLSFGLEDQIQAKLKRSWSARSEGGVGTGDVRRLGPEAEGCTRARGRIGVGIIATGTAEDVGEVDAIQDIEGFRAELSGEPFSELKFLGDGEIPIVEGEPAEVVSAGIAQRAEGRRNENRTAVGVAAQGAEGCDGSRAERGGFGVTRCIGGGGGRSGERGAVAGAGTREVRDSA